MSELIQYPINPYDVGQTPIRLGQIDESEVIEDMMIFYDRYNQIITHLPMADVPQFAEFLRKAHIAYRNATEQEAAEKELSG